ncbi:hypothetical protein ACFE04_022420 [Oxalis oulophora]
MGDCLKRNAKNVEETSITRKRRRVVDCVSNSNVELSDDIDSRRLCCTPPVAAVTSCSGGGVSSSDVSNDHTLTFVDDEAKSVKELFSRSSNYQTRHNYNFSTTREAPTSSEIMKTTEESPPPPQPPQQPPTPEELNEAMLQQLEDFLTAEENLQMEYFARKYNFDFVNEVPLEGGQYEWERVGDDQNKKP